MAFPRRHGAEERAEGRAEERGFFAHVARALPALAAGALAAACVLAAGCALVAPRLREPTLSIESVALERSDFVTQHLTVHMRVENPNDRTLPVRSLSYTLYIEGEEAAHAASDASFTVPALGQAEFDMHVTANMAGALLRLLARGGARGGIGYRVAGRVELSSGLLRSIPFEQSGTFKLR